ncbi:hypothetical protein P154DRAFT_77887 [Amniculicola lignicola CBS 123094]|uniref:Alpha-1,3-mannosyltransferase n=1 Tax=Amniculicola lignicola CBS 123094 TaxID=1392246 RepID=A0A6A5W2H0_9PLEO|nr:hypothetical protein P154DRAFT_77887 [Amniculicola lignicola CBS 123094]
MPPHLHPRSRMTTSLFTTTLAISFLVVAAPHILPCPVDNRAFADSANPDAMTGQRRRRRKVSPSEEPTCNDVLNEERMRREDMLRGKKRECPVPKPGGLIGQVLGLKNEGESEGEVEMEVRKARRRMRGEGEEEGEHRRS